MFKWTPDVASGHIILFLTLVLMKIFVVYWLARIFRICQDILVAARAGAGHSKLANEAAVDNGVKLQAVKRDTVDAVLRVKDDLLESAAGQTPVHTSLPEQLRVILTTEDQKPVVISAK